MTGLEIAGWGLVSPAGCAAAVEVGGMYDLPLPTTHAHALVDFSVRAELGRKGTSFFDRRTALTVLACARALADAGLQVTDGQRHRVGVVLGTTAGSVRSSVDYAVETFTQVPPYLVNPALFPNTVMNCAAGQSAIWFGFNGVNATLAGGRVAFLSVLRYCLNAFRTGQADVLLAGAVEEFTPHTAWLSQLQRGPAGPLPGEGGAVFVLRPPGAGGQPGDGEVRGVTLGFCPRDGDRSAAIAACVRRALHASGLDPDAVRVVAVGGAEDDDAGRTAWHAASSVLGHSLAERLRVEPDSGDNPTAAGALELAAVLARHRDNPGADGQGAVLVAHNAEGAVGAAVVRGWSRGSHRG